MSEAIALLKRSLAIDLSYAPAAALVGWCRIFQTAEGWRPATAGTPTERSSSGYHRADNNEVIAPQIAAQAPSDRSTVTIKDLLVSVR
jgi:hypothetical protein